MASLRKYCSYKYASWIVVHITKGICLAILPVTALQAMTTATLVRRNYPTGISLEQLAHVPAVVSSHLSCLPVASLQCVPQS